jgi:hypothetical protein
MNVRNFEDQDFLGFCLCNLSSDFPQVSLKLTPSVTMTDLNVRRHEAHGEVAVGSTVVDDCGVDQLRLAVNTFQHQAEIINV